MCNAEITKNVRNPNSKNVEPQSRHSHGQKKAGGMAEMATTVRLHSTSPHSGTQPPIILESTHVIGGTNIMNRANRR